MSQDKIDILHRALTRERAARKAAEKILEEKSRELYLSSLKIKQLLAEKSSELQGIFENIVDAYVVMDISGNIIKFNDSAQELFGYEMLFIAIDKTTHQIGIFDCSDAFYESGKNKVQQAVEQYKLFYENPDFNPNNYFINKTL